MGSSGRHPSLLPTSLEYTPTESQCQDIAEEHAADYLVACSNGAYDKATATASHGWTFAISLLETILASGAGPVDGHPNTSPLIEQNLVA
jgi:hypothetical protein